MITRAGSVLIILLLLTACDIFKTDDEVLESYSPDTDMWVGAYLGSWNHYAPPGGNWGHLPAEEIDWDAFTHLFYFSLFALEDGSLSPIEMYHNFSPDRINAITSAGHKHNTPVLFSVGGWGNYEGFSSAIRPENRGTFISNLVSVLKTWGFDGIDVDMEPINDADEQNYIEFITDLHRELQQIETPMGNRAMLTAATIWKPELFARLSDKFDQINLMTYDLSGAWRGWVSWHNAPVYDGGRVFESTGRPLPSADGLVDNFIDAGVPPEKLGIGIDFYGYIWRGEVTGPLQSWITAPTVSPNIPYYRIVEEYYDEKFYRWDDEAQAAYLSLDGDTLTENKFISYDDEKSIQSKIRYVREKGIGGTIIWEISGAHFSNEPEGSKDPLLQVVKQEVWGK
jgi:chitinase